MDHVTGSGRSLKEELQFSPNGDVSEMLRLLIKVFPPELKSCCFLVGPTLSRNRLRALRVNLWKKFLATCTRNQEVKKTGSQFLEDGKSKRLVAIRRRSCECCCSIHKSSWFAR